MLKHWSSTPLDVWDNIFGRLSTNDVLRVRLANKYLNDVVTHSSIWREKVVNRWFTDDASADLPSGDYFNYFVSRAADDSSYYEEIEAAVDSQVSVKDSISKAWQLIEKGDKYVPLLVALEKNFCNSPEQVRKYHFIRSILEALRRKKGFQTIHEGVLFNGVDSVFDLEEFYWQISYLDPCFDRLKSFRESFLDGILDQMHKFIESNEGFSDPNENAQEIVTRCLELVYNRRKNLTPRFQTTIEDNFVTRVYAGEALGNHLVISAIVQKICKNLGITVYITESLIVIGKNPTKDAITKSNILSTIFEWNHRSFYKVYNGEWELLYPFSKKPIFEELFYYFKLYYSSIKGDQKRIAEFLTFLPRSIYDAVIIQIPVKLESLLANFEERYIKSLIPNRVKDSESAVYSPGDIVYHRHWSRYGVVVGYRTNLNYNLAEEIFYVVLTTSGEEAIYSFKGLRKCLPSENSSDFQDAVVRFSQVPEMGMIFQTFDKARCTFVPTSILK